MFNPAVIDIGAVAAVLAFLGLGAGGGVIAWRKSDKETENISVRTVIEVNEELRRELDRKDEEIERLRSKLTKLRKEFDALEDEFRRVAGR